MRQEQSLPILRRIELQLRAEQHAHKSQTGNVAYTLGLREKLLVYTEHAQMEIDPKRSADNFRGK